MERQKSAIRIIFTLQPHLADRVDPQVGLHLTHKKSQVLRRALSCLDIKPDSTARAIRNNSQRRQNLLDFYIKGLTDSSVN